MYRNSGARAVISGWQLTFFLVWVAAVAEVITPTCRRLWQLLTGMYHSVRRRN